MGDDMGAAGGAVRGNPTGASQTAPRAGVRCAAATGGGTHQD